MSLSCLFPPPRSIPWSRPLSQPLHRGMWIQGWISTLVLDGCIVLNKHNTVFASKRICAQAVYFLHSTMPSVTCLRLSDVSVMCGVIYFQFPIQSAFLPCWSARQHSGVLVYAGVAKIWVGTFIVCGVGSPGEWFWIDSSGKMETRHPLQGYFDSEFRAICNHCHCGVMAAWSRQTWKSVE